MIERARLVPASVLVLFPVAAFVAWQAPALCAAFGIEPSCGPQAGWRCALCAASVAAFALAAAGGLFVQVTAPVRTVWIPAVVVLLGINAAYVCWSLA